MKVGSLVMVLNRTDETEAPAIVHAVTQGAGPGRYDLVVFDGRGATPMPAVMLCPDRAAAWQRKSLDDPDGVTRSHLAYDKGSQFIAFPFGGDDQADAAAPVDELPAADAQPTAEQYRAQAAELVAENAALRERLAAAAAEKVAPDPIAATAPWASSSPDPAASVVSGGAAAETQSPMFGTPA